MNIESPQNGTFAAGGGYGPPPGGYGPPGGAPGGYGPPGAPGGYGPPGAPGGMPPGGAPMAPPGGGPMMGMPGGGANPELKKQTQTWLIISIASVFVCGNTCFGVIGAILAYLAGQSADQGNIADAQGKLKWAKIVTIVGAILVVLAIIAYVIFFFVIAGANAM